MNTILIFTPTIVGSPYYTLEAFLRFSLYYLFTGKWLISKKQDSFL